MKAPISVELPGDASAPKLARRAVRDWFGGDDGERVDDLLLCVSEVVANAVLHARSPATLRAELDGELVRVEVVDGDPRLPERRLHDPTAVTGRGLHLLDKLAVRWGAAPHDGGGKVVWFEFDAARAAA